MLAVSKRPSRSRKYASLSDPVKKPARDAYLTIRISKGKRSAYEAAARADGRTLTGWVEWNLDGAVQNAREPYTDKELLQEIKRRVDISEDNGDFTFWLRTKLLRKCSGGKDR